MKATIEQQEDKYFVTLDGELDTAAAAEVEQTLQPLFSNNGLDVIIDCTNLEYISSSGLRLFLAVLKNAKPKGSHVYITGISDSLRSVFAMTGFTNLFEFK